jgi:hypothetical protein
MPIHEEILESARRICRERGTKTFYVSDIVQALPHLNPSSVRTHVVSRCCVNAPKNHPHKWPYFRRLKRGEYEIVVEYKTPRERTRRITEIPAAYIAAPPVRNTIHVVARRSAGVFFAEGLELALVTQGRSLDELLRNMKQAVRLHLEGENPACFGLSASPRIAMIYEEGWDGDAET